MQVELIQGSDPWLQFRLTHFGASEAAVMLGISPLAKRSELLHMKSTGLAKEFSEWVQSNILDYGHEVEALARPHVERDIDEELYPVTHEGDFALAGAPWRLSASLDGLNLSDTIAWEHKQWNEELAAAVAAGELPEHHAPQCQQELMLSGADKLMFTVSDGTAERKVSMWVYPDAAWFERLRAGWEQFAKDLLDYAPRQLAEKPAAEPIKSLPALVVQTRGEVVSSNLNAYKLAADRFIANIKTDLQTDDDFANAEATVRFCGDAEKDLELAKAAAIAQTASIDEVLRTVDHIKDQLRTKRLVLEKLVVKRKQEIKETILAEAKAAYLDHVAALEAEIKPLRLVQTPPDFAGAMKNKRTLASLHDAVDTLLASAKIATNAAATDYRSKQAWCRENADGFQFLLMDLQTIIAKPADDFQLLVTTRIADHKRAEETKAEALRVKIAAEEKQKAEAAAAETLRLARIEEARQTEQREAAERARVAADTKRQLEEQAQRIAAERAAEKPVVPASAAPEVARQASFYGEAAPARAAQLQAHADQHLADGRASALAERAAGLPGGSLRPGIADSLLDAVIDVGPTDDQIIAFGAEHDMDLDELLPRLERFIADVRAGRVLVAA
jgi:predicted phage-related endonuclease